MRSKIVILLGLGLLLAAGVAVALTNRQAAARLRAENATLSAERAEAQRLTAENTEIPALRQQKEEADRLREQSGELLRLRSEVPRLRAQVKDMDKLKAENQKLAEQGRKISTAKNPADATTLAADFVAKAALRDAGFASPEATVQTFFASLCQGNMARIGQCFVIGSQGVTLQTVSAQFGDQMKDFKGYRITDRKQVSEDEVMLAVMAVGMPLSGGDGVQPMRLKRVGNEWKLDDDRK